MRGIVLTASVGALIVSSAALAGIDVLFCQVAGHPKAVIPPGSGLPAGTEFLLATASGFDRPYASPDGTKIFFTGRAGTPAVTADDECFVLINGTSATTVAREGTTIGAPDANFVGPGPQRMSVNNSGQFVFGYNSASSATNDDYIVKFDGTNFIAAVQEGQAVPGVAGEAHGSTLQSPNILANGTVAYVTGSTVGALGTTQDDFCFVGNTALIQHGVTITTGTFVWDLFNTSDFWVTPDNAHWLMVGDDSNPTTTEDKVVVVDGAVVVREGQVLPGSGYTSPVASALGSYEIVQCNDGSWILRSHNVDAEDWIARNGVVVVSTDDPIIPASTELFVDDSPVQAYADCFFFIAGNAVGDYVVGGVTNAADVNANAVLVLNGDTVVAREGDRVDLNGNGLPDDDAFLSVFNNDDGVLTDDLRLVFFADLRNGAGTSIGQAVLSIDLGVTPCPGNTNGDGSVDVTDLLAVIGAWGACADPNNCPADVAPPGGDDVVNVTDLLAVIGAWGPCP